ncbi:GspH/FimT family pseudopilin [Variovorax sp.]|jgi:type IV fimbrial biogenesis protein FimT|uniref:GspH/FimT family pseudopilin n=1 Tax=Variovorax sp. TaxID=1871043 RepID=UPI0011FA6B40|nr:GspH/FimT family pseudopilin [Variovorax sp.]TAJ61961.1 MAG: prepilin-type N-terminal cleavage/methylation domain-containing protein [Variovorax sp.]
MKRAGPARGLTLIELLTVIAIVAILAAVGVPGFRALLLHQRLAAASQAFVAALGMARIEAIRRGEPVSVLADGAGWDAGWAVVTDVDGDHAPSVLRRFDGLPPGIAVDRELGDGLAQGVHYDGNGFSRRVRNAGFGAGCLAFKAETGRRAAIVLSASGRARSCDPDRKGECGTGVCGQGGG